MAKPAHTCPFSSKACTECGIYRGRHHYRSIPGHRVDAPGESIRPAATPLSAEFQLLRNAAEPHTGKYRGAEHEPSIRLKVVDVEKGETRICDLRELEAWDWTNAGVWRIIDGWQVTCFDRLIEILRHKAEAGQEEIEIYEAPRFMLLAGG
jgi:hypothetical protein